MDTLPAILLVDDEENILSALKRTLHNEPYRILTALDAKNAWELLARENIDLVVTDYAMPGQNGIELLHRIREQYPQTIRIMLTGKAGYQEAIQAINTGDVYRFLTKPWNNEELKTTLCLALDYKKTKDALAVAHQEIKQNNQILNASLAQLRELKEFNENIINNMSSGLLVMDLEGRLIKINKAALEILHLETENDALGRNVEELNPALKSFSEVADSFLQWEVEFPVSDQESTLLGFSTSYLRDPDGNPHGIIGIFRDLTELKKAEREIRKLSQFQESLIDSANVWMNVLDANGTVLVWNKAAEKISGYSKAEVVGTNTIMNLLYPDPGYRREVFSVIRMLFEQDGQVLDDYETTIQCKDGSKRILAWNARNLLDEKGMDIGFLGLGWDITKRKEAEDALQESEHRYRMLAENVSDIIWTTDLNLQFTFISPSVTKVLGFSGEEALQRTLLEAVAPGSHPQIEKAVSEELILEASGQADPYRSRNEILELTCKDGSTIWTETTLSYIRDQDNIVTAILGITRDITDRKRAEEALRESEERFRTFINEANDLIYIHDFAGNFILANKIALEFTGYSEEDIAHLNFIQLLRAENLEKAVDFTARMLQGEPPPPPYELEIVRKDGSTAVVELHTTVIYEHGQPYGILGVARDITERKQIEVERIRAGKLESLSLLAGGIAHDFNNILTAILANISFAKLTAAPDEEAHFSLTEAENECLRAQDLTRQLLSFAKGGAPLKKVISAVDVINESVQFALSGSHIEKKVLLPDDLWAVVADEGQIIQVLYNLLLNADQAMPNGGVVEVGATNISLTPEDNLSLPQGDYVKIAIKDHGTGIAKEHLSKIFDPYFTTKPKGNGLGLTTSYSIIKHHNGLLTFDTEWGVGSTFFVYLPADKTVVLRRREEVGEGRPESGEGKILIMDDAENIRSTVRRMLSSLGFTVATAADGAEAVAQYAEALTSGTPFDAVILDLSVRDGVGGKEAVRELQKLDANVKAIVSSGYALDPALSDYQKLGFRRVVYKPYKILDLSRVLNEVIKEEEYPSPAKTVGRLSPSLKERLTQDILVVDDDYKIRNLLKKFLSLKGYEVRTANNGEEGLAAVRDRLPNLVIMDVYMPGKSGLETFKAMRQIDPILPVIIITGQSTTDIAIEATKLGAFDFIVKPFDFNAVLGVAEQAIETGRVMRAQNIREKSPAKPAPEAIIGGSPAMQEVYKSIGRVAITDATVLLRGESGTGKELAARAIHQHSLRAERPFQVINCVAIPETLLESELFGYEKGAFTGASARRLGKIEAAEGGTVFLDEIGDMPVSIQAKILRLLQEKKIERLGGREPTSVDVRIIAATNRDLEELIASGKMREDLYYRLNVVAINLPPLRSRRSDIPLLCHYFLDKFAKELGMENPGMTEETQSLVESYPWPGNIRQLANTLKKALIFSRGYPLKPEDITQSALSEGATEAIGSGSELTHQLLKQWIRENLKEEGRTNLLPNLQDQIAQIILAETLQATGGNNSEAARRLGISLPTLRKMKRQFGVDSE